MKISATQSMVAKVVVVVMSLGLALPCSAWSQTINPKDWFVLTPQSYWHYSGEGVPPNGEIKNDNTMTVLEEKKDVGGGILATRMKMTTDNPTDNRNGDEQFWYVDPNDAEGKLVLYGLYNAKEDDMGSGKLSGTQNIIMETPILIGKNGQNIGDEVISTSKTKIMTSSGQMDATVNSKTKYKEMITQYDTMSSAFADGQPIPAKHSLAGGNLSPELSWVNPPTDTKSYVLFVDDPDAGGIWNHWIVYDVSPSTYSLPENSGAENGVNLPDGAKHGITSWNRSFYEGPAPPSGVHRYYFKLYALNVPVLNPADTSKAAIKAAMLGKVVGWTQVMGTYQAQ